MYYKFLYIVVVFVVNEKNKWMIERMNEWMNEYLIVAKAKLLSRRLCTLPDPPSPVTYILWHKSFFNQREDMEV